MKKDISVISISKLKLHNDDEEWQRILDKAATTQMSPNLRELFVIILVFCEPSWPRQLFDKFWTTWVEDY